MDGLDRVEEWIALPVGRTTKFADRVRDAIERQSKARLATASHRHPFGTSNDRESGTPEENKAIVQASIAIFGTYMVDEAAKTLTLHIN